MNSVEWLYTLGYKVFPSTRTAETDIEIFRERPPATKYSRRGWHGISYAFYDDDNNYGPTWKRIEVFSVDVTPVGLIEAHKALWGPLAALPPDASAADLLERRRALIRTFRVLLASVGIEYTIACKDDEIDSEPGGYGPACWEQIAWVLEAARDRWLARGVREACGFQLERDPEDEWRGIRSREEEARGFDDDDDDSDEEDYY
ncbi:hypothetical protein BD779DRAFT_1518377 [Infundibulicybe gibba]|nr:hypothetical protein BD779DRAFT_1518377 [Infundibulicybe gibba]